MRRLSSRTDEPACRASFVIGPILTLHSRPSRATGMTLWTGYDCPAGSLWALAPMPSMRHNCRQGEGRRGQSVLVSPLPTTAEGGDAAVAGVVCGGGMSDGVLIVPRHGRVCVRQTAVLDVDRAWSETMATPAFVRLLNKSRRIPVALILTTAPYPPLSSVGMADARHALGAASAGLDSRRSWRC